MSGPSRGCSGRYYDGFTAKIHPVTIEKAGSNIALKDFDGHIVRHWRCDDIRIIEKLPGQGYRLGLDSGELQRLVVEHPDAVAFIEANCPNLKKGAGFTWRAAKPYVIWGGGALASVLVLFLVIVPAIAPKVATWLPDSFTRQLGMQAESYLIEVLAKIGGRDPSEMICDDAAGSAAIETVAGRLAATANTDVALTVIRVDQPNALALPGGRILVFSGLIDFSEDPNELAGVLAHEIGHAAEKHSMQRVVESSVTGALVGLMFGDAIGATAFAIVGDAMLNGAYSRDKERQADDYAVWLMQENGWTVKPLGALFGRMVDKFGDQDGMFALVSSHPATAERIETLNALADDGGAAWSPEDWQAIKAVCGGG